MQRNVTFHSDRLTISGIVETPKGLEPGIRR